MRLKHLAQIVVALGLAACAGGEEDGEFRTADLPTVTHVGVRSTPEVTLEPSTLDEPTSTLPAHNKATGDLLVMTVNARIPASEDRGERDWTYRRNKIRDMIRSYNNGPHLIAMQELVDSTYAYVKSYLSDYWAVRLNRGDGEYVAVFGKKGRLSPVDYGGHIYELPTGKRAAVWAKVFDSDTGQTTYVYSTHFPASDSAFRVMMGNMLASDIAHRSDTNTHVIVMGDFNDGILPDTRYNTSYSNFLNKSGLFGAYDELYPLTPDWGFSTEDSYAKSIRHGRMIDHVLFSGTLAVAEADIDHSMFTNKLSEDPGTLVPCVIVTNDRCNDANRTYVFDLAAYSDHFAVWAKLHYW